MKRAAILVPFWSDTDNGHHLVLIRRTEGGSHPGQMAFPGGRHEPGRDGGLLETALRESAEEVGLKPGDVSVLGTLSERRTYSSEFVVTPFVARVPAAYPFRREEREVAAIVHAPLRLFRDPSVRPTLPYEFRGRSVDAPGVAVGDDVVWGLTLDVIDDLLASGLLGRR
jgi:8-oxo-dGTP pyrophosphatase MutT (NUDIX family)